MQSLQIANEILTFNKLVQPIASDEGPSISKSDLEDEELLNIRSRLAGLRIDLIKIKEDLYGSMTSKIDQINKAMHEKLMKCFNDILYPEILKLCENTSKTLLNYIKVIKSIKHYKQNKNDILLTFSSELEDFTTCYLELNDKIRQLEDITHTEILDFDRLMLLNIIAHSGSPTSLNIQDIIYTINSKLNSNNTTHYIDQSSIPDPNGCTEMQILLQKSISDFISLIENKFHESIDAIFQKKLSKIENEIDKKITLIESYLMYDHDMLRKYFSEIYQFLITDATKFFDFLQIKINKLNKNELIIKIMNQSWEIVEESLLDSVKYSHINKNKFRDYLNLEAFEKSIETICLKAFRKLKCANIQNFMLVDAEEKKIEEFLAEIDNLKGINIITFFKPLKMFGIMYDKKKILYTILDNDKSMKDLISTVEINTNVNIVEMVLPNFTINNTRLFSVSSKRKYLFLYLIIEAMKQMNENFSESTYQLGHLLILEKVLNFFINFVSKIENLSERNLGEFLKNPSIQISANVNLNIINQAKDSPNIGPQKITIKSGNVNSKRLITTKNTNDEKQISTTKIISENPLSDTKNFDLNLSSLQSNINSLGISKMSNAFDDAYKGIINRSTYMKSRTNDEIEDSKMWIKKEENFISSVFNGKNILCYDKFDNLRSIVDPNYIIYSKEESQAIFKEYMKNNMKYKLNIDYDREKQLNGLIFLFNPGVDTKYIVYLMINFKLKRIILYYLNDEIIDKPTKDSLKTKSLIKYIKHHFVDEKDNRKILDKLSRYEKCYCKIQYEDYDFIINYLKNHYFPYLYFYYNGIKEIPEKILSIDHNASIFYLYIYIKLLIILNLNLFPYIKFYKYMENENSLSNNDHIIKDKNIQNINKDYTLNSVEYFDNYDNMENYIERLISVFLKHNVKYHNINMIITMFQKEENHQNENIVLLNIVSMPMKDGKIAGLFEIICENDSISDLLKAFIKKQMSNENLKGFNIRHKCLSKSIYPCFLGHFFLPGLLQPSYDLYSAFAMCNFCPALTMNYLSELNETMKQNHEKAHINYKRNQIVIPKHISLKDAISEIGPIIINLNFDNSLEEFLTFKNIGICKIHQLKEICSILESYKRSKVKPSFYMNVASEKFKERSNNNYQGSSANLLYPNGSILSPSLISTISRIDSNIKLFDFESSKTTYMIIDGYDKKYSHPEDLGYLAFITITNDIVRIFVVEYDYKGQIQRNSKKSQIRQERQILLTSYGNLVVPDKKKISIVTVYLNFNFEDYNMNLTVQKLYCLNYLINNSNIICSNHSETITEVSFLSFLEENLSFFLKCDKEYKQNLIKYDEKANMPFDITDDIVTFINVYESVEKYKISASLNLMLYMIQMNYPYNDYIYAMKIKQENLLLVIMHNKILNSEDNILHSNINDHKLKLMVFYRKENDHQNYQQLLDSLVTQIKQQNTINLDFEILDYVLTNQTFSYFSNLPCIYLLAALSKKITEKRNSQNGSNRILIDDEITDVLVHFATCKSLLKSSQFS